MGGIDLSLLLSSDDDGENSFNGLLQILANNDLAAALLFLFHKMKS